MSLGFLYLEVTVNKSSYDSQAFCSGTVQVYLHGGHISEESHHNIFLLVTWRFSRWKEFPVTSLPVHPLVHVCFVPSEPCAPAAYVCGPTLCPLPCCILGYQFTGVDACEQIFIKLYENSMRLQIFTSRNFLTPWQQPLPNKGKIYKVVIDCTREWKFKASVLLLYTLQGFKSIWISVSISEISILIRFTGLEILFAEYLIKNSPLVLIYVTNGHEM